MDRRWTRVAGIGVATSVAVFAGCGAQANPSGGQVVRGAATITSTPGRTVIEQSSDKAIVNWHGGFSIGPGETTIFNMPSSRSIALNRDVSGNASALFGSLIANGQVWLINPNGVLIGKDAQINTHGFLATTSDIDDANFLAGNYRFDKPSANPQARVVNEGTIRVDDTGLAGLVAPEVRNEGTIVATLGEVVLAGTATFTLDFQGDGLIQFALPASSTHVANSGDIRADGGRVLLAAASAGDFVGDVIRMDGVVQARGVSRDGGRIVLDGGEGGGVRVAGLLDASSSAGDGRGGSVKVLGHTVGLEGGARLDVSGEAGGGTALVGGNKQGRGPERNAVYTTVAEGASIVADARGRGDGGDVVVWSERGTRFAGRISARGGAAGGNGGFAEVSGRHFLSATGDFDLSAPFGRTGTLLLDPNDITIGDETTPGGDVITSDGSFITAADIESWLDAANVVIRTGDADPAVVDPTPTPDPTDGITANPNADGNGDIYVQSGITAPDNANSLTLQANNDIILFADINMQASTGNLVLAAGVPGAAGPSPQPAGEIVSAGGAIRPGEGGIDLSAGERIVVDLVDGVANAGPITARSQTADIVITEKDSTVVSRTLTLGALTAPEGGILVEVDRAITVAGSLEAAPQQTDPGGDARTGVVSLYASRDASVASSREIVITGSIDAAEVNLRAPGDITGTGAIETGRLAITYGQNTTRVALDGDANRVDALAIGGVAGAIAPGVVFRNSAPRTRPALAVENIRAGTVGIYADTAVQLDGSIVATGADTALDGQTPAGRRISCPASSICIGSNGFRDNVAQFGLDPENSRFIVHSRNLGSERLGTYFVDNPAPAQDRGKPTAIGFETDPIPNDTNLFLYPPEDTLPFLPPTLLPPTGMILDSTSLQSVEEPPALFTAYKPPLPQTDSEELYAIEGNERLWR